MHERENSRRPRAGSGHPSSGKLFFGGASLPVSNIVLGPVLFVGSLGPEIVAALVVGTRVGVLIRLTPWVDRQLAGLDVGAMPAVGLGRRWSDERLQPLAGRGIVAHVNA